MPIFHIIDVLIKGALRVLYLLLVLRFMASWITNSGGSWYYSNRQLHPLVRLINFLTEPLVRPFQGMFPSMGIDFSPLVVALVLYFFVEPILFRIIIGY